MKETFAYQRSTSITMQLPEKAMELLDHYGSSDFVDAIQASRLTITFRKYVTTVIKDESSFWDDVTRNLEKSNSFSNDQKDIAGTA